MRGICEGGARSERRVGGGYCALPTATKKELEADEKTSAKGYRGADTQITRVVRAYHVHPLLAALQPRRQG